MDEMTADQKAECLELARAMDRVKAFPGGVKFVTDLFVETIAAQGLVVVDACLICGGDCAGASPPITNCPMRRLQ